MNQIIEQISQVIISPSGSQIYHMVVAFSILSALYSLTMVAQIRPSPLRRQIFGLSFLLAIQIGMFLVGWLTWISIFDARMMPVLDRGSILISTTLLIWLWAFIDKKSFADLATVLLAILFATTFIGGALWWKAQAEYLYFNQSLLDQLFAIIALVLLCVGIGLFFTRRTGGWIYGTVMLAAILAGILLHLIYPSPQDYSAPIRVMLMIAMPVLMTYPFQVHILSGAGSAALKQPAPLAFSQPGHLNPSLDHKKNGGHRPETAVQRLDGNGNKATATRRLANSTNIQERPPLPLNTLEFSLEELITKVVEGQLQALVDKDVAVRIHLPDRQRALVGNVALVTETLTCLCANAIQISPDNTEVEIKAEVLNEGSGYEILTIQVSDQGVKLRGNTPALETSLRHPINPRFFQREAEEPLKLGKLKAAIESAGGQISLEKDHQWGGVYHVELPVRLSDQPRKVIR